MFHSIKRKKKKSAFLAAECLLPRRTRRSTRAAAPKARPRRVGAAGTGTLNPRGPLRGHPGSRFARARRTWSAASRSRRRPKDKRRSSQAPLRPERASQARRRRRPNACGASAAAARTSPSTASAGGGAGSVRIRRAGAPLLGAARRRSRSAAPGSTRWEVQALEEARALPWKIPPRKERGASRKGEEPGTTAAPTATPAATKDSATPARRLAADATSTAKPILRNRRRRSPSRRGRFRFFLAVSPGAPADSARTCTRANSRTPPASPCTRRRGAPASRWTRGFRRTPEPSSRWSWSRRTPTSPASTACGAGARFRFPPRGLERRRPSPTRKSRNLRARSLALVPRFRFSSKTRRARTRRRRRWRRSRNTRGS